MNIASLLLLCLAPCLQEGWVDTHRVRLRNGNFLDGKLEQISDKEILLRWNPEAVTRILKIDVVSIEEIKIRTLTAKPKEVPLREAPEAKPKSGGETKGGAPTPPVALGPAGRFIARLMAEPGMTPQKAAGAVGASGLEGIRAVVAELSTFDAPKILFAFGALEALPELEFDAELVGILGASNPEVRAGAARLLGVRGATETLPSIFPLVRDSAPPVRAAAAGAIGKLGNAGHLENVTDLVADVDLKVRAAALQAAGDLGQRYGLANQLAERWLSLSRRARGSLLGDLARSLGSLNEKAGAGFPSAEVEGRLAEILDDRDERARTGAAWALGTSKSSDATAAILMTNLSTERQSAPAVAMIESLGRLKSLQALDGLVETLKHPTAEVRGAAQRALVSITGTSEPGSDPARWTAWIEANTSKVEGR